MKMTPPTTALRRVGARNDDGLVVLVDGDTATLDGSETSLLTTLASVSDLSSTSDELAATAMTLAERRDLDPARANIIRALALPSGARVLELGAECGAITRYLGENVVLVDALEPVASQAVVARARCRDLDNVEVFVGEIADLPAGNDYDVIIALGALMPTRSGTVPEEQYSEFLRSISALLAPGGQLVLGVENALGVKYLAGAPKDVSEVSSSRRLSRAELQRVLGAAGLNSRTLSVFPDQITSRVVMDSERLTGSACADLLEWLPIFPSPDRSGTRSEADDEGLLWASIVRAGLAADFANSFLVIATAGADSSMWPEGRLASYFSWDRKAEFTTVATIELDSDVRGATILRRPLRASVGDRKQPSPETRAPYVHGTGLVSLLLGGDLSTAKALIERWADLVREAEAPLTRELVPANVIVDGAGNFTVIGGQPPPQPDEVETVLRRGILLTAVLLAKSARRPDWLEAFHTPSDIAGLVASWVGITDAGWLDRALDEESQWLAERRAPLGVVIGRRPSLIRSELTAAMTERASTTPVPVAYPIDAARGVAAIRRLAHLEAEMADRLAQLQLQQFSMLENLDRHNARHIANLHAELAAARDELPAAKEELAAAKDELAAARDELFAARDGLSTLAAERDALAAEAQSQAELARSAQELNDDLRASISWRATAGLRAIRRSFGRTRS